MSKGVWGNQIHFLVLFTKQIIDAPPTEQLKENVFEINSHLNTITDTLLILASSPL